MTEQRQPAAVPEWTLGWRMQRALAHAGISVEDMAAELGVSRSTISRWVNDRGTPPRAGYLKLWSLRCGVDYGWLTGGAPNTGNPFLLFTLGNRALRLIRGGVAA